MGAYKEIAREFLQMSSRGESRQAFNRYVAETFKHHNAYFKGDAITLMTAMEENARKTPGKIFTIKLILEDENFVAVHSHVKQNASDTGTAVVHIFRFENGKIAELWDLGQPIPAGMVNQYGMF